MFQPATQLVSLPVFVVIHEWTRIINGHEKESSCEIIDVRHDEASAMKCRDDTIESICERRKREKYRIEVRKDSSGDAHIYAQPETDWFRSFRKDYVTIADYTMHVPINFLEDALRKENSYAN